MLRRYPILQRSVAEQFRLLNVAPSHASRIANTRLRSQEFFSDLLDAETKLKLLAVEGKLLFDRMVRELAADNAANRH